MYLAYFLIEPMKYEEFICHSISKKKTDLVTCIVAVMHKICEGLKNSTILPKPNKSIPRLVTVESGYWRWVPVTLQCYICLAGPGRISFDQKELHLINILRQIRDYKIFQKNIMLCTGSFLETHNVITGISVGWT